MTQKSTSTHTAQTWSSKSLAGRWQHDFFYMLIKFGGRWPAYIFSCFVVFFYLLFVPEVHQRASYYIAKRFPNASKPACWYHTWRLCQNLAFSLIDKAAAGIRGTNEFTYKLEDIEKLHELLAQKKGLILLTAHIGSWQASLGGLDTLNIPAHIMMFRAEGDVDSQYVDFRKSSNLHVVPVEDTIGSIIAVTAALRKNEIVSIMGDRIFPPNSQTTIVNFLGSKAPFPSAAYKIAKSTQAPIALLLTRKVGASHIELSVAHTLTVPKSAGEDFTPYVQEVAHILEQYVQTTPYQFYNFFDLWSTTNE